MSPMTTTERPCSMRSCMHLCDDADRKMVAAALEALEKTGFCAIAFASDTNWYGWQDALERRGLDIDAVIED